VTKQLIFSRHKGVLVGAVVVDYLGGSRIEHEAHVFLVEMDARSDRKEANLYFISLLMTAVFTFGTVELCTVDGESMPGIFGLSVLSVQNCVCPPSR
jgi:hypothetical protein